MKRLAAGDQQALRLLFMQHKLQVYRFIQRIVRNEAVAEEQTNEVFLDVWRNAASFQEESSPKTWILAIARNKAFGTFRRRREEPLDGSESDELADLASDPEVHTLVGDKTAKIRQCIDRLPLQHRMIVDLVYYHDLSVSEASEVAGLPEGTAKTRLFHARKKLSAMLEKAGIDRGWP